MAPNVGDSAMSWFETHQTTIDTLTNDVGAVAKDSTDMGSLSSNCTRLATDEHTAEQVPPIPDAQAQTHWAAALNDLRAGAKDCNAGASDSNLDQVMQGVGQIMKALGELQATMQRLTAAA
ncbi:hypothetical protein DN069_23555 [Streptacidiphilus pinicola]|uniref:Uncharacterized protein n=2 Tax=Streptacidiphilus pinicola TaxID=2219663 RepID=A0A2X0IHZ9_9ACTN|nr:hypothetical protein DN069_23555 [Streptacidiphilus pinicola]